MDSSLLMLSPTGIIIESTTGSANITVTPVTTTPGVYKLDQAIVIGITVGLIAGIPALAILCCCLRACFRKKTNKEKTLQAAIHTAKVSLRKQTFINKLAKEKGEGPYMIDAENGQIQQTRFNEPEREMTPIQQFTADENDGELSEDEKITYRKRPDNYGRDSVDSKPKHDQSTIWKNSSSVEAIDELEVKPDKKKKKKKVSKEKVEENSEEKRTRKEKKEKKEKKKKKKKEKDFDVENNKADEENPKPKKKKKPKFKATLDSLPEMDN